jgi:pimeloyl-ACP methyl ester carboxylesterase
MDFVTSADGTRIACERGGSGRPIVFVTGAFNDHHTAAPLAAALAADFTVITYDRRGRGESGDTRPYAIEREIDDLAAVIDLAGGGAAVFGFSSGALVAVSGAAEKLPISHLALYEAPFGIAPRSGDLPERLQALIDAGRAGDAVSLFQGEGIGLPAEVVAQIRESPMFPALVAIAQSTVYDATITRAYGGAGAPPSDRVSAGPEVSLSAVGLPALVMAGVATWPVLAQAAERLAAGLPDGRLERIAGGADHGIPVEATADAMRRFLI